MLDLNNQVILISGAKGGLGSPVTQACLSAGGLVVGSSKSIQDSDFVNPHFTAMPADLTVAASAERLVDEILRRFQRIDAVIHVMGGFAGGQPIPATDDDTWDRMMNLNLRSAFYILRAVIPPMRAAGRGRIVAISSRQAIEPAANLSAYNTSKAALVALIRTAALENKDAGITANSILPGAMNTEVNIKASPGMDPSKWVKTGQVAGIATFLLSDAGAAITGAAIPVYAAEL